MRKPVVAFVGTLLLGTSFAIHAGDATKAADEAAPEFTEAFMTDDANITAGAEIWKQCRHCHGKNAYPGKAPKVRAKRLKPDFIYDRVTNGFRKMPGWKAVFTQEQRMQVVAYIKSKKFSP